MFVDLRTGLCGSTTARQETSKSTTGTRITCTYLKRKKKEAEKQPKFSPSSGLLLYYLNTTTKRLLPLSCFHSTFHIHLLHFLLPTNPSSTPTTTPLPATPAHTPPTLIFLYTGTSPHHTPLYIALEIFVLLYFLFPFSASFHICVTTAKQQLVSY